MPSQGARPRQPLLKVTTEVCDDHCFETKSRLLRTIGPSPSSRRIQTLQYTVGALQKLAATRNAAVVILTQCATRLQAEKGATLIPAISAAVWEQGIATRVALYRDWVWNGSRISGARLATVQKANGKLASPTKERGYAFKIESVGRPSCACRANRVILAHANNWQGGLVPLKYNTLESVGAITYTPAQKRKLDETGFEIPDSEDEDYGWQEDDDNALPRPPPQWQGSEDILLGQKLEADDDSQADESEPEHEPEEEPDED